MILLVHGGAHGEMDADRFWVVPGVVGDLETAGHEVLAPDRLVEPRSWTEEADWLSGFVSGPTTVVAGSNGCSAALRLVLDHPSTLVKLILCWPATPAEGETPHVIRGVTDAELSRLAIPVVVVPSEPPNLHHRAKTVTALARLLPHVSIVAGSPESPSHAFPAYRKIFVQTLLANL